MLRRTGQLADISAIGLFLSSACGDNVVGLHVFRKVTNPCQYLSLVLWMCLVSVCCSVHRMGQR